MYSRRRVLTGAVLASAPLLAWKSVLAQDSFVASMEVADIGLPDGATDVVPVGINANGDVVVNGVVDGSPATFLFNGGSYSRIGGDAVTTGAAINDGGSVAGTASDDEGAQKAGLIGSDTVVFMPGDYVSGRALAVSTEGTVVGEAIVDEGGETQPVYWTESSIEILPALGDGGAGSVLDLNTILQMVGWSATGGDSIVRHATLWTDGAPTDLGTLGGNYSEARGINETGLIVGASMTNESQNALEEAGTAAVSWLDGQMTDLGLGPEHTWGIANDVNDVGMIVGLAGLSDAATAPAPTVAVLWTNGEALDLNTITTGGEGLTLAEAVGVNTFGQILCRAVDADGNTRVAILTVLGN